MRLQLKRKIFQKLFNIGLISILHFPLNAQDCWEFFKLYTWSNPTANPCTFKQVSIFQNQLSCPTYEGLELIFEDNFDGNSLDLTKWQYSYPWQNVSNSDYCATGGNNYEFTGTSIKLIAKEEVIYGPRLTYCPDGSNNINTCLADDDYVNYRKWNYTSGTIYSNMEFKDAGKAEIRCKIPTIDGVWPAFWLYGDCGQELDVFEFWNDYFDESSSSAGKRVRMTAHRDHTCGTKNTHCQNGGCWKSDDNFASDFHTYSIEWDPYKIIWEVDGEKRQVAYRLLTQAGNAITESDCSDIAAGTYFLNTLFPTGNADNDIIPSNSSRMHVIANLAVKNFEKYPQESFRGSYPSAFEIDYIKVWQKVKAIEPEDLPTCTAFTGDDITITKNFSGDDTKRIKNSIRTSGEVKIYHSADVYWSAGNSIELNEGFETSEGALFEADIKDCKEGLFRVANDNIDYTEIGNTSLKYTNTGKGIQQEANSYNSEQYAVKREVFLKNELSFNILPNPNTGSFTLLGAANNNEIFIYDLLGNLIHHQKAASANEQIDISSHPKGIYFVKIQTEDGNVEVKKIVYQ